MFNKSVFEKEKKLLERQRLDERTNFDLEMMGTTGSCSGIENYSRYLSGRKITRSVFNASTI